MPTVAWSEITTFSATSVTRPSVVGARVAPLRLVGAEREDAAVGVAVAHLPDERLDRDVDDLVGVREHELVAVVDQRLGEQHRAGRALGQPVDADDLAVGREVPDQRVGAVLLDVAVLQQHDRPPDAAEVLEHEVDHRPALDVDQRLRVLVADLGEALALAGGGDDDVDAVGLADRAHDAVVVDVGRVVDRAEHARRTRVAAALPTSESSITTHSSGRTPSRSNAAK